MTATADRLKARLTAHLEKKLARRIAYRDKLAQRFKPDARILVAQNRAIERLRSKLGQ